jgi:hypothetical protein
MRKKVLGLPIKKAVKEKLSSRLAGNEPVVGNYLSNREW